MVEELKILQQEDVDPYLTCIHCGLCTSSCPTYLELGSEVDSPRGRIHLMRSLAEGRLEWDDEVVGHLELCLDCQSCVTACPSGVQYGDLIEHAREKIEEDGHRPLKTRILLKVLRDWLFPYPGRMKVALAPLKLLYSLGMREGTALMNLVRRLPAPVPKMIDLVPSSLLMKPKEPIPTVIPAQGPERHRVALLRGCVGSVVFDHVNAATIRVLTANGVTVVVPEEQGCCGALHHHTGAADQTREFARHNIDVFEKEDVEAVLVNAAGCGSTLKNYGDILADDAAYAQRAKDFSAKVQDIVEFLAHIDFKEPKQATPLKVTYHDACHLAHGQGVTREPRELLSRVPGLELIPLAESDICCGSAGVYNLTEPDMSNRLLSRKIDNIVQTGANIVASGNSGCTLQIMSGLRERNLDVEVLHPIEILDRVYKAETDGAK